MFSNLTERMELKAGPVTPKTLRLRPFNKSRFKSRRIDSRCIKLQHSGFSLIEILIVLGIVGFISVVAIPRFENTNTKMRREVRSITVLMKRLHHLARLNRQTYRLVIDFPENAEHKYWVESTSRKVLFDNQGNRDKEKEKEAQEKNASEFQIDKGLTKKPIPLPNGIFFESLEIAGREEVISSGRAFIHFLPQGMAEESALILTDKKELNWTIELNPLTGQGEIIDGKAKLREVQKE